MGRSDGEVERMVSQDRYWIFHASPRTWSYHGAVATLGIVWPTKHKGKRVFRAQKYPIDENTPEYFTDRKEAMRWLEVTVRLGI